MAEKVEVSGGGDFDGAILKNAATEATLERLASAMEAKQKGLGQQVLGIATKVIQGNVKAQSQSTSAFQSFTQTLNQGNKTSQQLFQTFSNIAGTAIGTTFSLISTAGYTLLDFLKNGYTAFQEVNKTGASFNNNLLELRRAAAEAAIPLDDFVNLIKTNSQTMVNLGGTVTEGAKRFGQLSKEFRDSPFGNELTAMGYSLNEMNTLLADQLDLDMRGGKLRGKDNATLRKETQDYIMELDKLTKVTGLSRDQLQEGLKQAMKDGRVLTLQGQLTGNALTNFKNTMSLMNANIDPSMMNSLTQMMGGIIDPTDDFAKFLAMSVPGIQQFEEAVGKGQVSIEDQIKAYKDQSEAIKSYLSQFDQAVINTQPGLQKLAQYNASIQNLINANTGAAANEQRARDAITTAFGKVTKAFNDIYNKFIEKLMNNPIFQKIIDRLEQFAAVINNSSDDILKAFDGILSTFNTALGNFMDNVSKEGLISSLLTFFGDLFKGVKDNLLPVVAKVFMNMGEDPKLTAEKAALQNMSPEQREQAIARNPRLAEAYRTPQPGELPDFPNIFGPLVDGIKNLVSYVPSLTEFATFFGIAAGGSYVAGLGLAAGITEVGLALSGLAVELGGGLAAGLAALTPALAAIAIPALAVGAAIGIGAGGLGFAFKGLSEIINAVSDSFTKIKDFFTGMQNIDSTKLSSVGNAVVPLADGIKTLVSAGFQTLLGGGGLEVFAVSMKKFSEIDASKIESLGPALKALYEGINVFNQGGILENVSGAFKSFFTGGSLVAVSDLITKVNELKIDNTNVSNIVSLIGSMKIISDLNDINVNNVKTQELREIFVTLSEISKYDFKNINIDSIVNTIDNIKIGNIENIQKIFGSLRESLGLFESLNQNNNDNLKNYLVSIKNVLETVNELSNNNLNNQLQNFLLSIKDSLQSFNNITVSLDDNKLQVSLDSIKNILEKYNDLANVSNSDIQNSLISIKNTIISLNEIPSNNNFTNSLLTIEDALKTFNIDQSNIEKVISSVNAIGDLQSNMSDLFTIDSNGVDNFNKSIQNLIQTLESLEDRMKEVSNTKVNISTETNNVKRIGSIDIAGNSPEDLQKQLNMKIDELITHIVEMKQNTKDTADSLSERRSAV